MTYKIIHKNSTASGTPPASGDLDVGELAINAADAELYTKDTNGVVRTLSANTFTQDGTGAVQRTVKSKLQDVVSVKDFGAVGDGVIDDTVAIQAAIDAANASRTAFVFLPPGRYKTTATINLKHGVTLYGNSSPKVKFLTSSSVYFTQIRAEGTGAAIAMLDDGAVTVAGYSCAAVDGIEIRFTGTNKSGTSGIQVGEAAQQAIQAKIDNCLIQNFARGINVQGTWNVFVSNTYIYSTLTASPSDPAETFGVYVDAVARPVTSNYFKNVAVQACDVGFYFAGVLSYSGGESIYTDNCGIGFWFDGQGVSPGRGMSLVGVGVEAPRLRGIYVSESTVNITGFHFVKGSGTYEHNVLVASNGKLVIRGGDDVDTGSYGSIAAFQANSGTALTIHDIDLSPTAANCFIGTGLITYFNNGIVFKNSARYDVGEAKTIGVSTRNGPFSGYIDYYWLPDAATQSVPTTTGLTYSTFNVLTLPVNAIVSVTNVATSTSGHNINLRTEDITGFSSCGVVKHVTDVSGSGIVIGPGDSVLLVKKADGKLHHVKRV